MTQSVLMSVFFTIKHVASILWIRSKKALKIYIKTGKLPKLAELIASNG